MRKQAIWISIVVILLGVGVGLLVALPKGAFFTAQETTSLPGLNLPSNSEAYDNAVSQAANGALPMLEQFVADAVIGTASSGTVGDSRPFLPQLLFPKARADQGFCTKAEGEILNEAAKEMNDEFFRLLLAVLRAEGFNPDIIDPGCFTLVASTRLHIEVYEKPVPGVPLTFDHEVSVTRAAGVLKIFYFDINCKIIPKQIPFPQRTRYFQKLHNGKITSIDNIDDQDYTKTECVRDIDGTTAKFEMPANCTRCRNPISNPVDGDGGDGGSFDGTGGGT